MRLSALTVALLIAGGIGCSSPGKGGSSGTNSTGNGDNGNDAGMTTGAPDMGMAGGGGGGGGGGGAGGGDMAIGPGPWPLADITIYGAAQGLGGGIVDANPDDAQNIWAANGENLYLLRPGSSTFQVFTAANGLHIGPFTDPANNPNETRITAIAGGHAGQVYVGYYGYESDDAFKDTDAQKQLGNGDDVTVDASGTLSVHRLLFQCDAERGNGCWENRSPRRIIYSHLGIAAGHSWWGFNHGVTHVLGDDFGDHIHPEVWYTPSVPGNQGEEKLGEFYGIAPDASGNLWMAGRYGVGLQPWNPKPHGADPSADEWVSGSFIWAFTTDTADHSLGYPNGPTYVTRGYAENNRGAAVTPDGKLWLARLGGGLVSWDPSTRNYNTIQRYAQVPSDLMDVQADPDGSLWLVTSTGSLLRFTPSSGTLATWPGVSGVTRIYVDTMVTPRALYVSMSGGLAVIRAK